MSAVLEGLRRLPLGVEAARVLREAILGGRLKQGERMNETELSRHLGISRGPLREALRQLEHERLVEFSPYRGRRVVQITTQDALDVLAVRSLLEPYAARRALEEAGTELGKLLKTAAERMEALAGSGDSSAMAVAHNDFHAILYRHSGNQLLARLWVTMQDTVNLYLQVNQTTFGTIESVPSQHDEILSAVIRGDSEALQRHVQRHLEVSRDILDNAIGRTQGTRPRRASQAKASQARAKRRTELSRPLGQKKLGSRKRR